MIQKKQQDPLLWRNSGCFNESCGEFPTRSFTSYLRCVQTDIRCDWLFREDFQKLKEWDLASYVEFINWDEKYWEKTIEASQRLQVVVFTCHKVSLYLMTRPKCQMACLNFAVLWRRTKLAIQRIQKPATCRLACYLQSDLRVNRLSLFAWKAVAPCKLISAPFGSCCGVGTIEDIIWLRWAVAFAAHFWALGQ